MSSVPAARLAPVSAVGCRPNRPRAFTLVELMVVVGLIVIFVALGGIALGGRGGDGAALANAQNIVSGLLATARAQAALHNAPARLVIYAVLPPNGDATKYLRMLQVVREDPANAGVYFAVGSPVTLPTPICVVPPSPVPTTHLRAGVTWDNNVLTGPVSTLQTLAAFSYRGQPTGAVGTPGAQVGQFFGTAGSGRVYYLEIDPLGAITSNTTTNPTKLALTTAIVSTNAVPQFNNAGAVRGLTVRKTGAITLVNDATSF